MEIDLTFFTSWWEEATEEAVDEVIFLSHHTAVSNCPALTVHPIGDLLGPWGFPRPSY
ncbi:hypothetical protein F2Q69_00059292 [Brassica cretica]|uniref:Uncharacterized protein n=1 Tax=Brassica cretica TaxID=69181 RepID=A0A8S9RSE5_BRACR|nr:hypothetical protein F2Q69_00059292 [Brassica cretica]